MTDPDGAATPGVNRAMVTVAAMTATTVVILDQTIAPIALPHMQGGLSASQDQIAWVMTTYFVAQAVSMACTGWLAGRIGRKRLFMIALAGFAVGSVLSGSATSLNEILLYRVMQGAFSAPVIPISQAVMLDSYPRERHGQAIAIWGTGVVFAPVMGPVIGGWLTDSYGWQWVFYVSMPFALAGMLAGGAFLRKTAPDRDRRFDWLGFTALVVALGALQLMLDRGDQKGWFESTEIVIEAVCVVLGFYLFIVHMATTRNPFISPAILKDRNIMIGLGFMFVLGVFVLSMNVILPLFMQNLRGFPVLTAGLVMAPRGFATFLMLIMAGWLVRRLDGRLIIGLGFACVAVSAYQFSTFTPDVGIADFIWATAFNGLGIGLIWVPLTTISFETLPTQYRTEASTLTSLFRNYGSGMGISIVMSVLSRSTAVAHAEMNARITPYNKILQPPFLPEHWNPLTQEGMAALQVEMFRQAQAIGFLNDFTLISIGALASLPLLLFLKTEGPALHRRATTAR